MTKRKPPPPGLRYHLKLNGSPPGPLQREVLMVLHAARQEGLDPMYPKDIARVLSDVLRPNGTHKLVNESSIQGALSGMMVCNGRYWIAKHPFARYSITRNGLAWL